MTVFPLSAINQYLYCPRRAYLIHAEGVFAANEHTLLGDLAHKHVDFPGYEQRAGWTLLRALPLYSDTLGLSGKADLVEVRRASATGSSAAGSSTADSSALGSPLAGSSALGSPAAGSSASGSSMLDLSASGSPASGSSMLDSSEAGSSAADSSEASSSTAGLSAAGGKPGGIVEIRPVEYKKGPRRRFDNDDAQLCAQALCLEEMFGVRIAEGCVYHVSSQRRRDVCFDEALRARTRAAIAGLRRLIEAGEMPPAGLRPQCEGCSLHEICLPEAAGRPPARHLYEPLVYAS
ncbi:MAG: Dna2/Cas4 domain-containing protein [Puniceicoccales bacterium]|jgi:CRISPR/Cas system-associated exonuclease Cas4 (RecB family)|nr:Dna2/Cas4 domain-containing protein [Puniceicoccales bacterium]